MKAECGKCFWIEIVFIWGKKARLMERKIHKKRDEENSFNCFFLALLSAHTTEIRRGRRSKEFSSHSFHFSLFLAVDVIELWQKSSPFILFFLSTWKRALILNAVIANKFFNAFLFIEIEKEWTKSALE